MTFLAQTQIANIPAPPEPPATYNVRMGAVASVDLSGFVPGGPATYEVLTVEGGGLAEVRDSTQLIYQSTIESGIKRVTFRATQGAVTTDGAIDFTITDTFSVASEEARVAADIDNLIDLANEFNHANASTRQTYVYNGSYTAWGLRCMFQGTGDRLYFEKFKTFVDDAMASATVELTATTSSPASATPHEPYGATGGVYYTWGQTSPNQKAVDQWCMTVLLFLYDILAEKGEASTLLAADRTWAETAWNWHTRNCLERWRTTSQDLGVSITFVAESADSGVVPGGGTHRWGYWSSNLGVAMVASLIDEAIREELGEGDHAYHSVQEALSVTGSWPQGYTRAADWWAAFKTHIDTDSEGRMTWDVGNVNMNTDHSGNGFSDGWGDIGEHKAPDIGHGLGRYGYAAFVQAYTGQDEDAADICNGFDKQWSEICIRPEGYVTPDGTHEGLIAEGIQISNYIDGETDDFEFRYLVAGTTNAAGSNDGTGSHSYYSALGFKRAEARAGLLELYRNGRFFINPNNKECTGTYTRHAVKNPYNNGGLDSQSYAGFCLLGNFLTAMKQPLD